MPLNQAIEELPDLRLYQRIIIPFCDTLDQWSIVDIDLVTSHIIHGYFVGDQDPTTKQSIALHVSMILTHYFPAITFNYQFQLQIPTSYRVNPVMMSYLLIYNVNLRGQYLDINQHKIQRH